MTSSDDDLLFCRVCGLRFEEPPWGVDGRSPTYEICPCCGVEAGYEDSLLSAARNFREKWLAAGAQWGETKLRPDGWDLDGQLQQIPARFR